MSDLYKKAAEAEERGDYAAARKLYELAEDEARWRADEAQAVVDTTYWFFIDNARRMSCTEAEAIAALFRAFGKNDQGDAVIAAHTFGDDEVDDDHYGQAVSGKFTDEGFTPDQTSWAEAFAEAAERRRESPVSLAESIDD